MFGSAQPDVTSFANCLSGRSLASKRTQARQQGGRKIVPTACLFPRIVSILDPSLDPSYTPRNVEEQQVTLATNFHVYWTPKDHHVHI